MLLSHDYSLILQIECDKFLKQQPPAESLYLYIALISVVAQKKCICLRPNSRNYLLVNVVVLDYIIMFEI